MSLIVLYGCFVLEYINHALFLSYIAKRFTKNSFRTLVYLLHLNMLRFYRYPSCFIKWRFFNKPKACRKMLLMSSFTPPNLLSLYPLILLWAHPIYPHPRILVPVPVLLFRHAIQCSSYYIIRSQACVWGVFQETVQYFSVWWIMNRMDHTQLGGAFRSW